MRKISPKDFTGKDAWDALFIETINNATIKLHWTDEPYKWHINDGPEVFVVLDGEIEMHVRQQGKEEIIHLGCGDIFHAESGDEHIARPIKVSRILVIEQKGSV